MVNGLHPPIEVILSWPMPNETNPETQGPALTYVCIVFTSLSLLLVTARVYARCLITRAFGLDDLFCIITVVLGVALAVLVLITKRKYGTGQHMWDLPVGWISLNLRVTWVAEWCYVLATSCIKISILLFYKRLSAPFPMPFRLATYVGILYNVGYAIAWCLVLSLLCQPTEAYWNQFNPQWLAAGNKFHCGKEEYSLPSSGALSVLGDLYSTVLPLVLVWHLDLEFRKKLALYALFAVGFMVVIIGIVRTIYMHILLNRTFDVMWELDTVWIWTVLELNLAIIAASAPALKVFFQQLLILPATSLYKRVRTPFATNSEHQDQADMEICMLANSYSEEDKHPPLEEIGRAL